MDAPLEGEAFSRGLLFAFYSLVETIQSQFKGAEVMPFVLAPATEEDSEALVRLQFEACAEDPGFSVIFPQGATPESIATLAQQNRDALQNDSTCRIMKSTD